MGMQEVIRTGSKGGQIQDVLISRRRDFKYMDALFEDCDAI